MWNTCKQRNINRVVCIRRYFTLLRINKLKVVMRAKLPSLLQASVQELVPSSLLSQPLAILDPPPMQALSTSVTVPWAANKRLSQLQYEIECYVTNR